MPKRVSKFVESFLDDEKSLQYPSIVLSRDENSLMEFSQYPAVQPNYMPTNIDLLRIPTNSSNKLRRRSLGLERPQTEQVSNEGGQKHTVMEGHNISRRGMLRKASTVFKRRSISESSCDVSDIEQVPKPISRKRSMHNLGAQIASSFKPTAWKMFSKSSAHHNKETAEERTIRERREQAAAQYADFKKNMKSTYCGPPGRRSVSSVTRTSHSLPSTPDPTKPPSAHQHYRGKVDPALVTILGATPIKKRSPNAIDPTMADARQSEYLNFCQSEDNISKLHFKTVTRKPGLPDSGSLPDTSANNHTKHDSAVDMDSLSVHSDIFETNKKCTVAEKRLGRGFLHPPTILKRKRSVASIDYVATPEEVSQLAKTVKDLEEQLHFARQQLAEASAAPARQRAPENPFAPSYLHSDLPRSSRLPTIFSEGNLNDYIGLAVTTDE